jgi:ribonuclease T2
MKSSRRLGLVILLLLSCSVQAKQPKHTGGNQPGKFAYYALSLSWAPNFCASHSDPHECEKGKQYGFLVHGLWPQHMAGYPQSCSTKKITPELEAKYSPIFASPALIRHEWSKHGTCSGLQPAQYFDLTAALKQKLTIPSDYVRPEQPVRVSNEVFSKAIVAANPGFADYSVLPFCSDGGRFLQEVHVCYDKMGKSQNCSPSESKKSSTSCGQPNFLLQSVR